MPSQDSDIKFMQIALSLSRRGVGNTAPNPSVGCVIVKNFCIVGRGWTAVGGRPHAETIALGRAGDNAKNATAYVTLEPCSHVGETSPCAKALIKANIRKVVIATKDPNPLVSGAGIKMLEDAGIQVEVGLLEKEALRINEGFFSLINKKRPFITLKLATTSNGRIAIKNNTNNWFTGKRAKKHAHLLRYRNDAILVGVNTIIADNPQLTCRLAGLEEYSPVRVILDGNLRMPIESKITNISGGIKNLLFTCKKPLGDEYNRSEIITVSRDSQGHVDISSVLEELAKRGVTRLLVEGGGEIATSFLEDNWVDEIVWIQNKTAIGDGNAVDISKIIQSHLGNFNKESSRVYDNDLIEIYS